MGEAVGPADGTARGAVAIGGWEIGDATGGLTGALVGELCGAAGASTRVKIAPGLTLPHWASAAPV